jgi:hypothetical protein
MHQIVVTHSYQTYKVFKCLSLYIIVPVAACTQLHVLLYAYISTHAKVSHLVASMSTSCLRTVCPKLSTSLEQAVNNL